MQMLKLISGLVSLVQPLPSARGKAAAKWFFELTDPTVAMQGTVERWDGHRCFGLVDPDAEYKRLLGHDRKLLIQYGNIVDLGQWCRKGVRVAFKVRCGDNRATCLQVENIDDLVTKNFQF